MQFTRSRVQFLMKKNIQIFLVCFSIFTRGCVLQDAQGPNYSSANLDCRRPFLYPSVVLIDENARDNVNSLVVEVLSEMDALRRINDKFYFTDSECPVQLEWDSSSRLFVVPYWTEENGIEAAEFSDVFQASFRDKASESDFTSAYASERIILQE